MKKFYNTFLIAVFFISFGLFLAPISVSAWYDSYPSVNLGYNSSRGSYNNNYYRGYNDYNYNNNYNNHSSYNDNIYYGGNSNNYTTPYYDMNYGYRAPGYNQGYGQYNYNNNNYSNYNNYNSNYGSYYPTYTYSGWSRSYSYCTGMYCSQY